MRILQINTWYDKVGGAEIYMHNLVDCLREQGHQVAVFGFAEDREEREDLHRVVQRSEYQPGQLVADADLDRSFQEFADHFQPDLIHAHNLSVYPATFALALRRMNVPMVQTVHDFSLLCPNAWCVWADGTVCEGGAGAKCFQHDCSQNYPFNARQVAASHLRRELIKNSFEAFLCPSQFLADHIAAHGFEHTEGLPLWVDLEGKNIPDPEDQPPRNSDEILFLGRLVVEKGVAYLVEAMPHVLRTRPGAKLHVVGDGPELGNLKALAEELGVEGHCIFHGRIPHERVQEFYRRATLQVLPSIWCENSPLTTYESFLSGLPMVASRIAGLPAMVREGETGLLASPRDPADLARAIVEVLGDEDLQSHLQTGCRAALERYSREKHLQRVLEVYGEVQRRFTERERPESGLADADLLESVSQVYRDFANIEAWALDMKAHIDHLENSTPVVRPLISIRRQVRDMAKQVGRRLRSN